ncbi:gfo/Idh/MocA family oxidoreductase [Candidatus Bathyarchaeota archaeon]|nr:MAG: hypothetical protein B6U84_00800 [Candidatus Bathyarchaeota archaeon ex4484_40]RJS79898.1 MAG: gfo/Idh/MocA family oxidoreductase [Candidatus Bathyarchaeota archaeon]RLG96563.1 MAG: hypothetical protein DRO29_04455 [Candidatus Bathyarchaeota archaeon]
MSPVFKMGVIGVGTMGKTHIQTCRVQENVEVVAIADINKEILKSVSERFGIENAFTDYRDILRMKEVEAVVICTPPFTHAKIACDAASAGKHILCEKPMAMNSREAEAMVKASRKAGVVLGICSARSRFSPHVELAKRYLSEGKLGRVYYARFTMFRRRGRPGIDILKTSKWFIDSRKAGGGALIDIGCYDIDVLLYLMGSPQPASVSAVTFKGIEPTPSLESPFDVEEHSTAFVRFEGGLTATFETAWAANMENRNEVLILGSKGGLRLNPFTYYTEKDGEQVSFGADLSSKRVPTMERLIEDFVNACVEDGSPKTPGEDGLKVMQIIDMAYLSAKLGREVTLKELQSYA